MAALKGLQLVVSKATTLVERKVELLADVMAEQLAGC